MDLGLKGKTAIVTGAGSQIGFGRTIALTLAKEGCDIVVSDIDITGANKTVEQIIALGVKAIAVYCDITDGESVREMVNKAENEFRKIDILVNNAGGCTPPKPFMEMTEKDWMFDININLMGVLYATRAVLPGMIERKYGKIISIISGAGLNGGGGNTAVYSAAKAGMLRFLDGYGERDGSFGDQRELCITRTGDHGFCQERASGNAGTICQPDTHRQADGSPGCSQCGNVPGFGCGFRYCGAGDPRYGECVCIIQSCDELRVLLKRGAPFFCSSSGITRPNEREIQIITGH